MTDEIAFPADTVGRRVVLPDNREVAVFPLADGTTLLRFTNGARVIQFALSVDAVNALLHLLLADAAVA